MVKMYLNYALDSACPYHRILMPVRFCSEELEKKGWELYVGDGIPPGYDVYAVHGIVNETGLMELGRLKHRGAKVVWSLDDDFLSIPDWNPAKLQETGFVVHSMLRSLADWIIVSTEAIAKTFDDIREKVFIAPNLMDLSVFPTYPFIEEIQDGIARRNYAHEVELPIRVVWVGGHTHRGDLEVMTEGLDMFLSRKPTKAIVVYKGMTPPSQLLKKYLHKNLLHESPVPFSAYQKSLNALKPNIYLCPLADIPFNLSKSNIRILEGWGLMSAPIASRVGEYNCIVAGEDGRYATTPDEWYNALCRLTGDHEYRLRLASNGRQRLERDWSWQNPECRKPWMDAFTRILESV